ncbi:hypothetical protein [Microbaculum marinisediminis]|uniref:Uncharacterized protein n=1 Tax=Microbaculum marinisediminis TaxID=2931392 RepID=A0AAW5QR88_9HYPH|nr:hypothetical protein [Microbaculum sp. A6E488]MCT8970586.1 hypothetical protein [Microbaculum sp. A6E488]
MSLERTALRLATLLALTDAGDGSGTHPTLAGRYWYDTLMEPVHEFGEDRTVPLGIVYTDADGGPNVERAGGGLTFDRSVELTLELVCATTRKADDGVVIEMPQTDAELEAVLDLLEYQSIRALTNVASTWGRLWGRMIRGITEIASSRVMDSKGETRFAARTVTLTVRLPASCPVDVVALPPTNDPPPSGGIGDLPGPLRLVAEAVAAASGGQAKTVQEIVAYLMEAGVPTTALLPVLATVGLEVHAGEVAEGKVGVVNAPIGNLDI